MLRDLGRTYSQIAELYNTKPSKIYNILHDKIEGVPIDFVPLSVYMKEYGYSHDKAYWHIRVGNIKYVKVSNRLYVSLDTKINKHTRGLTSDAIDIIVQMLKHSELSYRAIGKLVGCSGQTVKNYKDMLC